MTDEVPGEPVMILRAGDIVAPDTVRAWADMAERCRADPRLVGRARDLADQMEEWARAHGHQVPGVGAQTVERRKARRDRRAIERQAAELDPLGGDPPRH